MVHSGYHLSPQFVARPHLLQTVVWLRIFLTQGPSQGCLEGRLAVWFVREGRGQPCSVYYPTCPPVPEPCRSAGQSEKRLGPHCLLDAPAPSGLSSVCRLPLSWRRPRISGGSVLSLQADLAVAIRADPDNALGVIHKWRAHLGIHR